MRQYSYVILILLIGGPSVFLLASAKSTDQDVKYVVFIDAGSSGSRAHIHSYTWGGKNSIPKVDASKNLKVKPGLSSYAENPSGAGAGLSDLRQFLEEKIPENLRYVTELHLQATAGLRVLEPNTAEAILESVRDELQTWGFKFERTWARLISGREEGLNGWIAANYLENVFSKPNVKQEDSIGVVEMGGASLQISYCPDNLEQYNQEQIGKLAPIHLVGHTFYVYTYSYLNFGQEKAEELLLEKAKAEITADGNPCLLRGTKNAPNPVGDYDKCVSLIDQRLFDDQKVKGDCGSCSFTGVFQPKHAGEKFFAIENFFYTPEFFDIQNDKDFVGKLMEKGRKFCKMDFDTAKTTWPKEDVRKYCFSGAYQASMLKHGLGFSKAQLSQDVQIAREIKGEGIDWALGAVINAITGAMADDPYTNGHLKGASSSSYLLWFLLFAGAGGGGYWYYTKKKKGGMNRSRYSPLDKV